MRKPTNKVQSLMAAIQKKMPQPPKVESEEAPEAVPKQIERRKNSSGKGNQFWLQDEDRKHIRELYAWLAAQGIRSSDTAIVKTALRMANPGPEFLEAHRSVTNKKQ
jgi:hypothetical protein